MNQEEEEWLVRYFERVIAEQDRRVEQALAAAKDAVDKAEKAQERRLDLLNEFRAQAADEARKYALKDPTERRLNLLENFQAKLIGGFGIVLIIGVANLVKIWVG